MKTLTQQRLMELLTYNPDTGIITWKVNRGGAQIGKPGGRITNRGYRRVNIDGRGYFVHRLAFLFMTGRMPIVTDHINGDRDDNRWCNLREATVSQNTQNTKVYSRNKSGIKGVSWCNREKRWIAQIVVEGKRHFLGQHREIASAETAVRAGRERLHGEFCNHGEHLKNINGEG